MRVIGTFVIAIFVLFLENTPARGDQTQIFSVSVTSAVLSAFNKTPTSLQAWVLLPDSYYKTPSERYPVIFWIPGFKGTDKINVDTELQWQRPMRQSGTQFIVVFMNPMIATGHQEYADSANNGPWGAAFTTEFIPALDGRFRTIGTPATRFLAGHSSGGWSVLWLQINYPELFGGAWAASPDPVDFHDFLGPDLTLNPPQNFYTDVNGVNYGTCRFAGKDSLTLRDFALHIRWAIWQFNSFEAVFSPKGLDGKPEPLFDRKTGMINEVVAKYWESHYDIAEILRTRWPQIGPELQGKLHLIVGAADTFHLEEPMLRLQKELQGLGSDAEFDFVPGADHFTIFNWDGGLYGHILKQATALLSP